MEGMSSTVLFAAGSTQYRVSDVVRAACAWEDLAALEEAVRQGVACLKRRRERVPADA
jgi:hypothetical protein